MMMMCEKCECRKEILVLFALLYTDMKACNEVNTSSRISFHIQPKCFLIHIFISSKLLIPSYLLFLNFKCFFV